MKKNIIISAIAALCLVACQPEPIDESTLFLTEDAVLSLIEEDGGTLLTLNDFVNQYMTEQGNFYSDTCPYRDRATNGTYWVFSVDTIPANGPSIYIRGRVITEDVAGNFYKSMVIQQIVDGKQQALRLSVDASSVSGQYALGQEILIRVNGLAIGRYANQPQLCVPAYNNNIYASKATEKVGWAPGRIPFARFSKATKRIGKPEPAKIQCDVIKMTDFLNIDLSDLATVREWDGKLVRLENVHFTGQYDNYGELDDCTTGNPQTDKNANVFAPTTENVGYPQGQIIADAEGNNTIVSNSEYAKFAHYYLPSSSYVGTISGILGFYNDNAKYPFEKLDWSITLRGLKFIGFGSVDDILLYDTEEEGNPMWQPREYGN